MDCTGSMGSYIKSATDNIRTIVDEIVSKEKITMRLALVEYRDHPPQVCLLANYSIDRTIVRFRMQRLSHECIVSLIQ